jgi:threonine synthase
VLVATAHPAKFREIVEPLIGQAVTIPENLQRLFELPTRCTEIAATLDALREVIAR